MISTNTYVDKPIQLDNDTIKYSILDVAISAPFGDQPGTVYIYAGAGTDIIDENPIQVITRSCMYIEHY